MENFKIVADSSCDLLTLPGVPFAVASLKIITQQQEYVDDAALDVDAMVQALAEYKGRSTTSCPNPEDWLLAFGDAQQILCVCITGTLSGCYNAAVLAKAMYEELYPDRQVFVINSLSTGPECRLIIEKAAALYAAGTPFAQLCQQVEDYRQHTGLLFMLESMQNLSQNGRVSPLVAKAAGLLGIRVVGRASSAGDLMPLDKCRGRDRGLAALVHRLHAHGYNGGRVHIAHCQNLPGAQSLQQLLQQQYPDAEINLYPCRGLCSFYAEQGGLLVGFEGA